MMASSRGRDRSSPRDGRGFGRIGCLLHQAEEHAIMNRAETEDGSYASARNRKLLAGLGLKPGENEYAEPALNPCQTTAYAFFTGDYLRGDVGIGILDFDKFVGVNVVTPPGFQEPPGGYRLDSKSTGDQVFVGIGAGYQFNNTKSQSG